MKRKWILGLLIFLAGAMMAACGSDSNGNSAAPAVDNTTVVPASFDSFNLGCTSCDKTIYGQFVVTSHDAYIYGFDKNYSSSSGTNYDFDIDSYRNGFGNTFNNILQDLFYDYLDYELAEFYCDGRRFISERAFQDAGYIREDCIISNVNDDSGDNNDYLSTLYIATVDLTIDSNGDVIEIFVDIDSDNDFNDGWDSVRFGQTSNVNVFESFDGDMYLRNTNGNLHIYNANGEKIGYFQ